MQRARRLALLTYPAVPELTSDDQLLLGPLKAAGFDPVPVVWSDVRPSSIEADLVVIRSTWDYHLDPERFLEWLTEFELTGKNLFNSTSTIRWNMRKDYLFRLEASGVSIPRTVHFSEWRPELLTSMTGIPVVVKPVVSAGAFNTHRLLHWTIDTVEPLVSPLFEQGAVLVQEYMPEIETDGEWSFIFLDRHFSHAVTKIAAPLDFRVQEEHGGTLTVRPPDPKILEQVRSILATVPDELLYARVDGVVRSGRFFLMELELFEPSLYLSFEPRAAEDFAASLIRLTEHHGNRR